LFHPQKNHLCTADGWIRSLNRACASPPAAARVAQEFTRSAELSKADRGCQGVNG
jgi:hypothetical protein